MLNLALENKAGYVGLGGCGGGETRSVEPPLRIGDKAVIFYSKRNEFWTEIRVVLTVLTKATKLYAYTTLHTMLIKIRNLLRLKSLDC